ncbi:MAG: hypothetical protein PHP62_00505 [Candidatus Moranbacteria bacterium]|nr:hypothetical protein [Candidatus Moranbacteria bacterium]
MMNASKVRDPRHWKKWANSGAIGTIRTAQDRQIAEFRRTTGINAVVREIDGQMVLDDPEALAMIQAVNAHNGKQNCRNTLAINAERVLHFKNRLTERNMSASDAVIVLLNVDDVHGGPLADALMPNYNWQEIRDQGEVPFARGLAMREGIQEILGGFDKEAAKKLLEMSEVAVVVVDHGVAEVFAA